MTAVEWLQEKYKQQGTIFNVQFDEAKEMEKEQRKNDFREGWYGNKHKDWNCEFYLQKHLNEIFKSE